MTTTSTGFTVHSVETAPAAARPRLEAGQKMLGFVPNLYGVFAEAPNVLEAYQTLSQVYDKGTFSKTEQQVVTITANIENGCTYCVAAHSTLAEKQGVPADVITALRDEQPLADAKLEALRRFARAVVVKRGWVDDAEVQTFLDAGYTRGQILEVILGVAFKTLSNYANHIADTPRDAAFEATAWEGRRSTAAAA